jgi:integrase
MVTGSVSWSLTPAKVLTRPEVESILFLAQEKHQRDYTLLCVAANTGFRISETIHLTADGFDGQRLQVTRRKKKVLRPQTVEVAPALAWIIGEHLGTRTTGYFFPGAATPCYIKHLDGRRTKVCDGGHVSRREIQRRWDNYLSVLGLRAYGRGVHTLRHFAISEFYGKYKDLRAAQVYAGHSSSTITEVYAHVRDMSEKIQGMEVTV